MTAETIEPNTNPILIHLHVPKCAGSSVNTALARHFKGRCYTHAAAPKSNMQNIENITKEQFDDKYDVVFGHFRFGFHKNFNRNYYYFSATRDPLDRICSFFNFLHTRPQHSSHKFIKSTLRDLNDLNEDILSLPNFRGPWRNVFCRSYSGMMQPISEDNYDTVKRRVIRQCMSGKMLISNLNEIQEFLDVLGVGKIPVRNVTDTTKFDDFVPARAPDLTPRVRDLIAAELCYFDYELLHTIEKRTEHISGREFGERILEEINKSKQFSADQ